MSRAEGCVRRFGDHRARADPQHHVQVLVGFLAEEGCGGDHAVEVALEGGAGGFEGHRRASEYSSDARRSLPVRAGGGAGSCRVLIVQRSTPQESAAEGRVWRAGAGRATRAAIAASAARTRTMRTRRLLKTLPRRHQGPAGYRLLAGPRHGLLAERPAALVRPDGRASASSAREPYGGDAQRGVPRASWPQCFSQAMPSLSASSRLL